MPPRFQNIPLHLIDRHVLSRLSATNAARLGASSRQYRANAQRHVNARMATDERYIVHQFKTNLHTILTHFFDGLSRRQHSRHPMDSAEVVVIVPLLTNRPNRNSVTGLVRSVRFMYNVHNRVHLHMDFSYGAPGYVTQFDFEVLTHEPGIRRTHTHHFPNTQDVPAPYARMRQIIADAVNRATREFNIRVRLPYISARSRQQRR